MELEGPWDQLTTTGWMFFLQAYLIGCSNYKWVKILFSGCPSRHGGKKPSPSNSLDRRIEIHRWNQHLMPSRCPSLSTKKRKIQAILLCERLSLRKGKKTTKDSISSQNSIQNFKTINWIKISSGEIAKRIKIRFPNQYSIITLCNFPNEAYLASQIFPFKFKNVFFRS